MPVRIAGWKPFALIAVTVTAVVILRGVISLRGYLYADDYAFRYWAQTQPFGWTYLTQSYGGHVNPVGLLNQWVLQEFFPGSHTALALFTLLLWAATLILASLTAMELTDRWQAAVVMALIAGLSLFAFENTTWWAAAIYAGPYQLFLTAGLYCVVRSLRRQAPRWSWLAVVACGGAVFSFSRGFSAALLMFLVAALVPVAGPRRLGIVGAWRWQRRVWVTMAGLSAAGVSLVLFSSSDIARPGFNLFALPGYMWRLLVLNVLPAIWGGPWRWFEILPQVWNPVVANPAPPWWMVWASMLATLAAGVAIWRRRPALRGLLQGVGTFIVFVLLVAGLARSGTPVESVAYRYTFDILWPVVLLATLVAVPLWWQSNSRISRPVVAGVAIVCASCVVSTLVPARAWVDNPGELYMANAVAGFSRIPAGQIVLNQGVPFDLVHPALMAPYANAQVVMTPEPGAPEFGLVARDTLWGWAEDGSVEEQTVAGPTSEPGPDPECGYQVTDVPRSIPLDGKLIAWDFYARVAYFSGTSTTLNLAVGGRISSVDLDAGGLRAVYFPVNGPGEDVLVSVSTPGVSVCLTKIEIGNRVSQETGDLVPLPVTKLAR
ncbi:MAG: hypothetical protein R2686_05150 [Candidatus Nanopelagicales bacterium]